MADPVPSHGALVLASTSPQRRAILEQLRIPFEMVPPSYVEHDPPDADPVELVRAHAEGKARSVHREGAITLGVDTTVHLDGRLYGKPANARDAARMLRRALRTDAQRALRDLPARHRASRWSSTPPRRSRSARSRAPTSGRTWQAASGRGAPVPTRSRGSAGVSWRAIDGDYLNVVGLARCAARRPARAPCARAAGCRH